MTERVIALENTKGQEATKKNKTEREKWRTLLKFGEVKQCFINWMRRPTKSNVRFPCLYF